MDENLIIELYQSGKSETEIAKQLDTSRYFISKVLVKNNINKRQTDKELHKVISTLDKETFYQLYVIENKSYAEIAAQYSCTERQIKRLNATYRCKKVQSDINKNRYAGLKSYYNSDIGKIKVKEISSATKKTVKEKYGVDNVFQLQSVKEKIKQTNLKKYGTENPMKNKQIASKVSESLISKFSEKYNRPNGNQQIESRDSLLKVILDLPEDRRTFYDIAKNTGYSVSYITHKIQEFDLSEYITYLTNTSHYEDELVNFINSLGSKTIRNSRDILNGKELDIYCENEKVGIEFNGTYWHSDKIVDKKYHYEKSKLAEEKGIRLIHVYEYQWEDPIKQEIIKSLIKNALSKNTNKIYARKCIIKELKCSEIEDFSNNNSLHGHRKANICLGLFYNGELVEVMTFGHAFFSKDKTIDYECIRSITKINTTVIGGMTKLFKYFINKYNPTKVLYYVDYNTHNGSSMNTLGFVFQSYSKFGVVNIANDLEVEKRYGKLFSRRPDKNTELKELSNSGKIYTIYDAGVKTYIWERSTK